MSEIVELDTWFSISILLEGFSMPLMVNVNDLRYLVNSYSEVRFSLEKIRLNKYLWAYISQRL